MCDITATMAAFLIGGDEPRRVEQMLPGKKWELPEHQRPASTAAGSRQVQAGAGNTDVTPKQQQLLQPAVSNASELSVRYVLAEHYLSVVTPLTNRLLISSKEALATPDALRIHSITHVLLLCCGPEVTPLTPSGNLSCVFCCHHTWDRTPLSTVSCFLRLQPSHRRWLNQDVSVRATNIWDGYWQTQQRTKCSWWKGKV